MTLSIRRHPQKFPTIKRIKITIFVVISRYQLCRVYYFSVNILPRQHWDILRVFYHCHDSHEPASTRDQIPERRNLSHQSARVCWVTQDPVCRGRVSSPTTGHLGGPSVNKEQPQRAIRRNTRLSRLAAAVSFVPEPDPGPPPIRPGYVV